ncbi:MAG: TRAP transporter small permease subunit [Burkholderiales bacterium]|nr:MAG: TRAP transporter small permease subunit [Burkholderiales bacterium]
MIDRLTAAGAAFAAACCAVLAAMLITEVIATSGFDWSQPWAVEYGAYLCAITLLGGSGYAVRHASHIRVWVVLSYLPQPLAKALDFACTLAALAIASILAYGMVELAWRSWERDSVSYFVMETPLAIPQALLAVASLLLALALLARALRFLIGEPPDLTEDRIAGRGRAE